MGNTERSVLVRLNANPIGFIAGFRAAKAEASDFRRELDSGNRSIDKFSGRLGLLVDTAATLGPALVPIGAVGIPALVGLANAAGLAALGGGAVIFAFQGVGKALEAVNKARVEPTTANLHAAHLAMQQLGPDARALVGQLADLSGQVKDLRNASASGVLPGVSSAIDDVLTRAPQVEKILHRIGTAAGDMIAAGGASLASPEWDDFFDFIEHEAPDGIRALGESVGNLAHATAELWMAFGPLNADGLDWLVRVTDQIDAWATGLSKTQGFEEFVAYIRENGPRVGDLLLAVANGLLQIVEAAAPIGSATLPLLTAVANIIADIADSDLGTPLVAFLALSRAAALFDRGLQSGPIRSVRQLRTDIGTMASASAGAWGTAEGSVKKYDEAAKRTRATLGTLAGGAAIIGGLAAAQSGLTDKLGLTQTATLGLTGAMIGGAPGAAAGGLIGLFEDFRHGVGDVSAEVQAYSRLLDQNAQNVQDYADVVQQALDQVSATSSQFVPANIGDQLLGSINPQNIKFNLAAIFGNLDSTDLGRAGAQANQLEAEYGDLTLAINQVGQSLGLVKWGDATTNVNRLQAILKQAAPAMQALGISTGDLQAAARDGSLPALVAKIAEWSANADMTKGALANLTAEGDINSDGIVNNTDVILANIQARNDQTDAMLASFDAMTAYQRALDAGSDREKQAAAIRAQIAAAEAQGSQRRADLQSQLANAKTPAERARIQREINDSIKQQADTVKGLKDQLSEYANTLDKTTKAGQANRDILSQMAAGWNNLSDKQQNAKGAYKQAREDLIDQAKKFGATDKLAKHFADTLLEIPPKIETKIVLDQQRAQRMLDAYSKAFNGLDGKVAKTVVQLRIDQITGPGGKLDRASRGDGSYMVGGFTGYMPPDKEAGVVHGREFVVPAPYAERDRAELEKRYLPGYRQGGYVEPARLVPAAGPSLSAGDLDRIGEAAGVAAARFARPLYGDQYVSGDPTTWRRQREADLRSAAVGGLIDAG